MIVHELTAIGRLNTRHIARDFAQTNRLRTEGTDHLLSAGQAVGVQRFVAQGIAGWSYARTGGPVKTEDDPVESAPARAMRETLAAVRHLEDAVIGADWTEGIVLRYGVFYGPGTSLAPGRSSSSWSASASSRWSATAAACGRSSTSPTRPTRRSSAVERGGRGVYNVVDDDPAPVAEWLPALADQLGAKKPMRVPRFVGRLSAGEAGVVMMTEVRGASNAKAKRDLGWHPAHPTWREALAAA